VVRVGRITGRGENEGVKKGKGQRGEKGKKKEEWEGKWEEAGAGVGFVSSSQKRLTRRFHRN